MLDDFVIRASLAGLGVALAAGPLGCFVVWRRMAYFGDATAHAAVLGVALALTFHVPILAGVLVTALAMAVGVSVLAGRIHSMDVLLGVMAHSSLAIGLVAVSFLPGVQVDLVALLFGDILAVTRTDLIVIWSGGALVMALLIWRWSVLLTSVLNPDLAVASGVNPRREQLVLTLAMAVVVAVAIKVIGALLIAALLVIPAAAARTLTNTPEAMAITSAAIGAGAALGGMQASLTWDTPTGPTIVAVAACIFGGLVLFASVVRRR